MAPLIVLIVATLLARLAGQLGVRSLRDWAAATRVGLAVMFCFTAAAHFNNMRADMIRRASRYKNSMSDCGSRSGYLARAETLDRPRLSGGRCRGRGSA